MGSGEGTRGTPALSRTKRAVFMGLMLFFGITLAEGAAYVLGKGMQQKWLMWRPARDVVASISYDEYRRIRDPLLGWPYPKQFGRDLDVNGAQLNPLYPHHKQPRPCISLYGDSFTEGGDTNSVAENWGNVLSKRLGCYVANYGMGGYGTDQAYLRFEKNTGDNAPVVVFGVHPEDFIRNVTRTRDLQQYSIGFAMKPRFAIDERGDLTLVNIPDLTEQEYLHVLGARSPLTKLEHESLQPGGPAGAVDLAFPFTYSVVRNCITFYGCKSRVLRYPEWMEFLERGHPTRALDIGVAITRKFVDLARSRGKSHLIVLLPHPLDIVYFKRKGVWAYANYLEEMKKLDIPVFDFGPYLIAEVDRQKRPLDDFVGPTKHYNTSGNALVAAFVEQLVQQSGKRP